MANVRFSGSFDDLDRFLELLGDESGDDLSVTFTVTGDIESRAEYGDSQWNDDEEEKCDDSDYEAEDESCYVDAPQSQRRGKFDDEDDTSHQEREQARKNEMERRRRRIDNQKDFDDYEEQ